MELMKAKTQFGNASVREVLNHTSLLLPPCSEPSSDRVFCCDVTQSREATHKTLHVSDSCLPTSLGCPDQPPNALCKSLREAEGGLRQQAGIRMASHFPHSSSKAPGLLPALFSPTAWASEERTSDSDATMVLLGEARKLLKSIKMSKHWPSFLQTDINCLAHIRALHSPPQGLGSPSLPGGGKGDRGEGLSHTQPQSPLAPGAGCL